jgi:hypothetical protein
MAGVLLLMMSTLLSAEQVAVDLLVYQVERPGEEPYINRLLISEQFLRLDQGEADAGFILYEREKQIIYSVNPAESSILVIDPVANQDRETAEPEIELVSEEKDDVPSVGGVDPVYWRMMVNGSSCREAFVLPSTLSSGLAVYGDYLRLLSVQQGVALQALPEAFQDACDNAVHVYAADAFVQKGLPLKIWDNKGYSEALLDFKQDFKLDSEQFILPENYQQVPMGAGG